MSPDPQLQGQAGLRTQLRLGHRGSYWFKGNRLTPVQNRHLVPLAAREPGLAPGGRDQAVRNPHFGLGQPLQHLLAEDPELPPQNRLRHRQGQQGAHGALHLRRRLRDPQHQEGQAQEEVQKRLREEALQGSGD